jgi:hypothetical protein
MRAVDARDRGHLRGVLNVYILGSNSADGPLVGGISGAQAAEIAASDPAALAKYLNARLLAAEAQLPEGAAVQLSVTGWQTPIGSSAQFVADQINSAWTSGEIVDPQTGSPPEPWREYPGQIAFGDDATDTVTIRVLKEQPPLVALYILIGVAAVIAIAVVWDNLSSPSTPWTAQSSVPPAVALNAGGILKFITQNWAILALGAGGLVAMPFIIRHIAQTREAENELRAAERGRY